MRSDVMVLDSNLDEVTMTSLEMVDFINSLRGEDEAELRHDHFMAKVPKVLGEDHAPKFRDMIEVAVGKGATRQSPIYRFPEREACLMAMSYSYELQAKVYDHMRALRAKLKRVIAMPDFTDPAAAAEAWAAQYRALVAAEKTKAEIGNRREATAMATASAAVRKASKLEIELDRSKQYATVKRMEMAYHGIKFDWRLLKSTSIQMELPPIDVFDQNYGTVKAYHAEVWSEAYAVGVPE